MLSFDDYLQDRIGMGKGQLLVFSILSLAQFMNGFVELFPTILINLLAEEWNIAVYQQAALIFVFFSGAMSGNLIVSLFADRFGRKNMLILSQLISVSAIILNSYALQYYQVVTLIFSYGLVFGVSWPICFIIAGEIVPVQIRGRYLVMLQLIYIMGILYLIIQCAIYMDSLSSGNWRVMLRINILSPIISLLGSYYFLEESPRFYIMKGEYDVGFNILDQIGKMNDKDYERITDEERTAIINWQEDIVKGHKQQVQICDLFHDHVFKLTMFILGIFWIFNIVSCAIIVITPFLAGKTEKQFGGMFVAYFMEIPAIFFALLLFDNKVWGGRIKIILYGLTIMLIGQILLIYHQHEFITYGMVMLRFSFRLIWSGLNALPTESYNTYLRSLGVGLAYGTGKIPGSIASIFVIPLFYESPFLPFYFGIGFTLILILLVYKYPLDTTQQPLDNNREFYNKSDDAQIYDDSEFNQSKTDSIEQSD